MKNVKLTICLVVKNEEKYIYRCLDSVKSEAYEIIVVDTGSDDSTVEIAKRFTDKIYTIKWRDDFSKARNFALSKASGDWVLFLDGDEELTSESLPALRQRISCEDYEGYLIKVLNCYEADKKVDMSPDVVFRLYRNRREYRYTGAIHEQICDNIIKTNPAAQIHIAEDICIIHYGYLPEEVMAKNKAERNTRLLLKAVKKNPDCLLDHFHLGVEYFRANQFDKALGEFHFVLDKVEMSALYVPKLMRYITKCHYVSGDLSEALRFIEKVWEPNFPDQGDLYYLKGLIFKVLERYPEAHAAFKKCLSVPPQPAFYGSEYCQYKDKTYHQLGELAEYPD